MGRTVDVSTYGAIGDGTTNDAAAINSAIAQLHPGSVLSFPPSAMGYFVGVGTVFQLQWGASVSGVAGANVVGSDAAVRSNDVGLVLAGDSSGILGIRRGYVFDTVGGRVVYAPNALVWPGNPISVGGMGRYVMPLQMMNGAYYNIRTAWSDNNATSIVPNDWVTSVQAGLIDPQIASLPNGHLVLGFHESTANKLHFRRSRDGGRTWPEAWVVEGTAHPYQQFTEVMMVVVRPMGSGVQNRIVCCVCDAHPDAARDSVYRTMYSDNEGQSWSAWTVVTPASGSASAGLINDATRAWLFVDDNAQIQLMYPRKIGGSAGEIWHESLDANGQNPSGAPAKVAIVQRLTDGEGVWYGSFPVVVRMRTGEFALFYTASDHGSGGNTGEMHLLSSTSGSKGSFGADRNLGTISPLPGGFGRIWPLRKDDGTLELIHAAVPNSTTCEVRSMRVYGT